MMEIPNVCPRCYSSAVVIGVETVRCQVCRWSGTRDDLLGVASAGLTLEEKLAKFTQDLLALFSVTSSGMLEFFLARWGVVDPTDKEQMRIVTAWVVGRMASGVLQYCMGDELDIVPTEEGVPVDEFVERLGAGVADYMVHAGLVDLDQPNASGEIGSEVGVLVSRITVSVIDCLVKRQRDREEGGEYEPGTPEGGGDAG